MTQDNLTEAHSKKLEEEISKLRRELEREQLLSEGTSTIHDVQQQVRSKSLELEETKLTLTETFGKMKRMEATLTNQIIELEAKISEKESTVQKLKEELKASAETTGSHLQKQLDSLKNIVSLKDQEIEELRQRFPVNRTSEKSDEREISIKLQECQKQLEKCEKQKLESLEAFQTSEREHRQIVLSYRTKIKEQNEKLRKMDKKLKNMEAYAHEQIDLLQENMEKEHNITIEKMKSKMIELKRSHMAAMETSRRQHSAAVDELQKQLNRPRRTTSAQVT